MRAAAAQMYIWKSSLWQMQRDNPLPKTPRKQRILIRPTQTARVGMNFNQMFIKIGISGNCQPFVPLFSQQLVCGRVDNEFNFN